MRDRHSLERRQQEVLTRIVRLYVSSGVPVGSQAVVDEFHEPVSSATVRNIMVELESGGFLEQPHVSAGRVPTDQAYRFYADRVTGTVRLGVEAERYIDERLAGEPSSAEELMSRISHILSEVSHNVGLVLAPALQEKLLEHVKFVALGDRRVLAVIVSKPELIENRVIRLEEEMSQEELDRAAQYLNAEFRGWTLRTIRLEVFKRLEEMKVVCDTLLTRVAGLFWGGALGSEESGPLFVEGTARILDQPDFMEAEKLQELMAAFEEKVKLIRILSGCLESPSRGVRILIGRENPESGMQRCTFIVAPYSYRDHVVGALGVVGPTRMEYDRAITAVDYVAQSTSRILSGN